MACILYVCLCTKTLIKQMFWLQMAPMEITFEDSAGHKFGTWDLGWSSLNETNAYTIF